jgi:microsomal dipeptidase-like Zn-dependent dipeptidase
MGVGFWSEATCGTTVDAIADTIDYIARLVGDAHVALGSDWDGCVAVPPGLDAAGVAQVTHALRARGYEGAPLARIMGGNALRVLRAALVPGGGGAGGAGASAAAGGGG